MIVSVTRLRLRSIRFLPQFVWHATRSYRQSTASPGNVRTEARRIGLSFWTLSVWRDEASLRSFLVSGAHGHAMPRLEHWCDEAATARWTADAPSADWRAAETRLRETGRLHPVRHPSPAHQAGHLPGSS